MNITANVRYEFVFPYFTPWLRCHGACVAEAFCNSVYTLPDQSRITARILCDRGLTQERGGHTTNGWYFDFRRIRTVDITEINYE